MNGLFCIAGPLNNLKESMIQFSKPRKLVNRTNPVRYLFILSLNILFHLIPANFVDWIVPSRAWNLVKQHGVHLPFLMCHVLSKLLTAWPSPCTHLPVFLLRAAVSWAAPCSTPVKRWSAVVCMTVRYLRHPWILQPSMTLTSTLMTGSVTSEPSEPFHPLLLQGSRYPWGCLSPRCLPHTTPTLGRWVYLVNLYLRF